MKLEPFSFILCPTSLKSHILYLYGRDWVSVNTFHIFSWFLLCSLFWAGGWGPRTGNNTSWAEVEVQANVMLWSVTLNEKHHEADSFMLGILCAYRKCSVSVLLVCFLFCHAAWYVRSSSLNRNRTPPPELEAWSLNHWLAKEVPQ